MATPSTVQLLRPQIGIARQPESHESRLRRLFGRRGRRRRAALVSSWRQEATLRGLTRMGA